MNTQWQDFLTSRGAVLTNDHVAHFGRPPQELQAVAQGTIMADLSHLGLLEVAGEDAVAFLQGQLTNDVKLLDGNQSHYAGYCTAKGRLLAIFLAFAHQDHLHLQLNGARKELVLKRLKMYVLRSKVTITDVTDSLCRFGIAGTQAASALQALFAQIPQLPHQLVTLDNATLLRLPGPVPRYEIFTTPDHAPGFWSQLQSTCTPVGTTCWDWLEIQAGIPDVVPATAEAFVPQMVNLDSVGGINFKKGCYTGQEIVARTHYLGKVKRRMYLAHIATDAPPLPGTPLFGADTADAIGQIVRAAAAPTGGCHVLAELRSESVIAGIIRAGAPDGAILSFETLPYAVA